MKYAEYPVEHLDIFDRQSSNLAFEEEVGMTGFGLAPVKPEGNPITFEGSEQGWIDRYTHITYGLDLGLCLVTGKANPLNCEDTLRGNPQRSQGNLERSTTIAKASRIKRSEAGGNLV